MGFKFVHNLLGYRFETFGKSVLNETNLKVCYLGVLISLCLFQLFYVQGVVKALLCCLSCKGFHGRSREVRIWPC